VDGHVEGELDGAPELVITADGFFPRAADMRAVFDERFGDPYAVHGHRFVWDYWHVPHQYTLVRTPAEDYFGPELYAEFHAALTAWGRANLGCSRTTPVWLSYYVDGCEQQLHCDNPHGPWAFVFSLTDWENRRFEGGETMLLRGDTLDFWRSHEAGGMVEFAQLADVVAPEFNRLTVFDPRLPHGVRAVRVSPAPAGGDPARRPAPRRPPPPPAAPDRARRRLRRGRGTRGPGGSWRTGGSSSPSPSTRET